MSKNSPEILEGGERQKPLIPGDGEPSGSSNPNEELSLLIKQQKMDDVPFIRPEEFVSFSLDQITTEGNESFVDYYLGNDYRIKQNRLYMGCVLHGKGDMHVLPDGRLRCRACGRESKKKWLETTRAKPEVYQQLEKTRNEKRRQRWAEDPEYRAKEKLRTDKYKKAFNAKVKERKANA